MRAVIQRIEEASVSIDGTIVGSCGRGYLIFLGIGETDTENEVDRLWSKIYKLRIFPDGEKATGATLSDIDGQVLIVSQFTLYADCRKGNRPSFAQAGDPIQSQRLYELFINRAKQDVAQVASGQFGADMRVSLTNEGPFTIFLDTDDLTRSRRHSPSL